MLRHVNQKINNSEYVFMRWKMLLKIMFSNQIIQKKIVCLWDSDTYIYKSGNSCAARVIWLSRWHFNLIV